MTINIAINGFGRIGRLITRQLITANSGHIQIKAVNTLENIDTAAHLLKYDSNHGTFNASVETAGNSLIVNGQAIQFYNESDPVNLPWQDNSVDIVMECSGRFFEGDKAARHLKSGAKKVIITAAAVKPDITLCIGTNSQLYDRSKHHIISGASCTTNCIAPIVKLINDAFGIRACLATFLHSYTNGQNLLDSYSHDLRRCRAVGQNILPTSTSAVQQIPEVIPELSDKFDALAVRVPTPVMHLADLTMLLNMPVDKKQLVETLEHAAKNKLKSILLINSSPLVSVDMKGGTFSSIIDGSSIFTNDNMLKLLIWHDNEMSYCHRMIDLLKMIADL